jgi:hypothetical protein
LATLGHAIEREIRFAWLLRRRTYMSNPVTVTFALSALTLALAGCISPSKEEPNPEPEPETVTIPLASIFSTNGQEGLLSLRNGAADPCEFDMAAIRREVGSGSSNIFLANAGDIVQAVNATREAFLGGRSAEVPVLPELAGGPKPTSFWMVAFLGVTGSEPPAWVVRSAERKGKVIRLSVQRPAGGGETKDSHLYFVWVPLGKMEPGKYTLELFDAKKKEVTLKRRVAVGAK